MSSDSRQGVLAVSGTFLGLGALSFGLRLFARKEQHMPLKADDLFAFLSLVSLSKDNRALPADLV